MMRKLAWPTLAAMIAAAAVAGLAVGGSGETNRTSFKYAIGLWGDLPYSDAQATTGVPNLIADMNNSDIEFSVHDGDLKAGNGTPGSTTPTTCSDALYVQGLQYFNSLDRPAMFTRRTAGSTRSGGSTTSGRCFSARRSRSAGID